LTTAPQSGHKFVRPFFSNGFRICQEAENGLIAIKIAVDCKPDIVILDLSMPIMNGIDAAPKLRALLPEVPIILFTLYDATLADQDLTSLGISATFSKGDPLDELLQKAHQLLEDNYPRPKL
jgi:DNA-binding NarL/FixJ family response regulator